MVDSVADHDPQPAQQPKEPGGPSQGKYLLTEWCERKKHTHAHTHAHTHTNENQTVVQPLIILRYRIASDFAIQNR
jgi:hypothetical protein